MVDVLYDVRSHIRAGADPDKHSQQLKQFHKTLWSKPLPNGTFFNLTDTESGAYLAHRSDLGSFTLSSDSIVHSLSQVKYVEEVVKQAGSARLAEILSLFNTVPGFIVFPSNQVDGQMTINAARGCHVRIRDRFDLTLECIRRSYLGIDNPLFAVLSRYADFFALFDDFQGYCDFFLLQDLWDTRRERIKFYLPFDDSFPAHPLPNNLLKYDQYIEAQSVLIQSRAERMRR